MKHFISVSYLLQPLRHQNMDKTSFSGWLYVRKHRKTTQTRSVSAQPWSHMLLEQCLAIAMLHLQKPFSKWSWVGADGKTRIPSRTHCRFGWGVQQGWAGQQHLIFTRQTSPFQEELLEINIQRSSPFSVGPKWTPILWTLQPEAGKPSEFWLSFLHPAVSAFNCFLAWDSFAASVQWHKQMETCATSDSFIWKHLIWEFHGNFKVIKLFIDFFPSLILISVTSSYCLCRASKKPVFSKSHPHLKGINKLISKEHNMAKFMKILSITDSEKDSQETRY